MNHSPSDPFDVHPAARDASPIEKADVAVTEAAAQRREHPAVKLLGGISELADQPPLITICGAVLAAGIFAGRPRLARAGGRMLAAELIGIVLKSAIKQRVNRTRPHLLLDEGRYETGGDSEDRSPVNSFPSGHTVGAVAVARAWTREFPNHAASAALLATGVAAIQIPRAKHYPTDLAAGAIVGLAAEKIVDLAACVVR
jgi:membrane-associated phospholipid phosphatase